MALLTGQVTGGCGYGSRLECRAVWLPRRGRYAASFTVFKDANRGLPRRGGYALHEISQVKLVH